MLRQMQSNDGDSLREREDENFVESINDRDTHITKMTDRFNQARNAVDYD